MKKLYKLIYGILFFNSIISVGYSQSLNVSYQFYLDANNNCIYNPGETLLYNISGNATLNYIDASSATVIAGSSLTCGSSITVNNPQMPPVNSFSFANSSVGSITPFSINLSCPAYTNLSYTATNYLPVQSLGPITNLTYFTNATGNYTVSSSTLAFPVCSNFSRDTINLRFDVDNIYSCASVNSSRTYSVYVDAALHDVVTINGWLGPNSASSSSCTVNEVYYNPTSTIWIRIRMNNSNLFLGNHVLEIRSTPIYTPSLSALNYSCNINASPCSILSGSIYNDCDNNCSKGSGDMSAYMAAYVKLFDAANTFSIYPAYNGSFTAFIPQSTSQYSITSVPLSGIFTPCSTATLVSSVPLYSPIYNFGYKSGSYVDPEIGSPRIPGGIAVLPNQIRNINCFWSNYPVSATCPSSYPVNPGKVKLILDKNFTYQNAVGSTPIPNSIIPGPSGDTIVWNEANLNVTTTQYYAVAAMMASSVSIGDPCTNIAIISPLSDNNITNNFSVFNFIVGTPFDPNNKISWASGIQANGDIPLSTQDIFYTINFQNIGTAPAVNVKSIDTLDANLDWNTLQVTSSSFPVQTQKDNASGQVIFNFQNINLPDSTSNEPGSHGYVSYRIKLKPSVPANTIIKNRAHNYFDFNLPIATNQTQNKLVQFAGIDEFDLEKNIRISPNPFTDKINLYSSDEISVVKIYNSLGSEMSTQLVNNTTVQLYLSELPDGLYIVRLFHKNGMVIAKKIIKNQ